MYARYAHWVGMSVCACVFARKAMMHTTHRLARWALLRLLTNAHAFYIV